MTLTSFVLRKFLPRITEHGPALSTAQQVYGYAVTMMVAEAAREPQSFRVAEALMVIPFFSGIVRPVPRPI